MGIDGLLLIVGGVVILAAGIGFYLFVKNIKTNRETLRAEVANVKAKVEDIINKNI